MLNYSLWDQTDATQTVGVPQDQTKWNVNYNFSTGLTTLNILALTSFHSYTLGITYLTTS